MYQNTAQFYDFFDGDAKESVNRANLILSLVDSPPGILLDIGAGTGEIAFMLAEKGCRVFCFEPSPAMYSILVDRLSDRRDLFNQVSAIPMKLEELPDSIGAKEEQESAYNSLRDQGLLMTERLRIGRDYDKSSVIKLKDAKGRVRIELKVEANGNPKINFLDELGQVTYSLPKNSAR